MLIVVDDASRWYFVTLLRNATMDVVSSALRAILRLASGDESVLRTKILRTDNGTEFKNKLVDALLAEADIRRELTCVGTSHQNGIAERGIGVIFAIARTMLTDASLPSPFWGEAVMTAVYVRNRLPCSANENNMSPFEARYGRRPDLRHLRPFGVTAYVRIKHHITKVVPRAEKGIMIGYGEAVSSQKGWRIYLPASKRVITTTDVTFARDLQTSIRSRHPSLVSVEPPVFADGTGTGSTVETGELPASLQLSPATPPAPATSYVPAPDASIAPDAPAVGTAIAPTAHAGGTAIPPDITPAAPTRTAVDAPTPRAGRYVTPIITTPAVPDPARPPVGTATVRRPRGRPPANTRWDPRRGAYVAVLVTVSVPNYHHVWCAVADSSPFSVTPSTYREAVTGPDGPAWRAAIKSEFDSLRECRTWRIIRRSDMPRGSVPIRCKWVFKLKRDENNNVARFKARLTACGYAQRFGRDYDETFSPVASAASIRFVFALAACCGLFLDQHDIRTAFLYGVLPQHQRVYLRVPEGMVLSAEYHRCLSTKFYLLNTY